MSDAPKPRENKKLAVVLLSVALGMVGVSFAAVPLYRVFCQATGYLGTTQRATAGAERTLERRVVVRFDSNVSGLPWKFRPEVPQVEVKLGETAMVNFIAENTSGRETRGTATFNVSPNIAGVYFNKIQCFCFTDQKLKGGEHALMPVQFFVSPDMVDDRELASTRTITLSYTFFPAGGERQPVAQAGGDGTEESM